MSTVDSIFERLIQHKMYLDNCDEILYSGDDEKLQEFCREITCEIYTMFENTFPEVS